MPIPTLSQIDFKAALVHGAILYYPEPCLGTLIPHNFIIAAIDRTDDIYYSVCSTSQLATVERLIATNTFPESTFVWIPARDTTTPLTRDSYLNCNEHFRYQFSELWTIYQAGDMELKGVLPDEYYHQIINGYKISDQIEEEIKELLPDIQ